MLRSLRLGALLALAVIPIRAEAQAKAGPNFNIAAGLTVPTSNFGDRNNTGYNLIAGIGMAQRGSALGFRAEGIYNEFDPKNGGEKSRAGGITANVVFDLIPPSTAQSNTVYVIGGFGYYQTRETIRFITTSDNNTGWNLGGGFKFPLSGFSAYLEARYHAVSNVDVKFIPISFGLVF